MALCVCVCVCVSVCMCANCVCVCVPICLQSLRCHSLGEFAVSAAVRESNELESYKKGVACRMVERDRETKKEKLEGNPNDYAIKPASNEKFKANKVREIMKEVMKLKLDDIQ
jgi:hypothetical protein